MYRTSKTAALAIAALGLTAVQPTLAASYTYTTLDDPAAAASGLPSGTYAYGINNSSQVAGFYGDTNGFHGFLYTPGTGFTTLDVPNATSTFGHGLNNKGTVVGSYTKSDEAHGFLYSSGIGFTTLDDPNATNGSLVQGINDAGSVVGYYADTNHLNHSFLFIPGTGPGTGFVTLDDPDATEGTYAHGINNAGQVTGYYINASGSHGFLYSFATGFSTLDNPAEIGNTRPFGLNDAGQVVGNDFLYTPGSGFTPLIDPDAVNGTRANGINTQGQITGNYTGSTFTSHGFLATPPSHPVPEISSLDSFGFLILLGTGGVLVNRAVGRRRTQNKQVNTLP